MNELQNISKLENMMMQLIELQTDSQKTVMDTRKSVEHIKEDVEALSGRVKTLEVHEEITYEQQNAIDALISSVVYDRLGIGPRPSEWTIDERTLNAKYGKLFRRRLRKEVSNKGHLAFPFRTTHKGNFSDACKDIEAWYPRGGTASLMKEADDNALARKIAKEQGYD